MAKQKTEIQKVEDKIQLNVQQELFCQLYVNNSDFFGNATLCYAAAYNIDLESKKDRKKNYKVANAAGARLLANVSIKDYIYKLLNAMMKDEYIDGELAKVIFQDYKLDQKVAAIREYNRVRNRVKAPGPTNAIQINIQDDREKYK